MTLLEQQITEYLQQQESAKRVLVAIKKARRREELPCALSVADAPLAISEEHSFYIFRTDTNAVLASGIQGFEAAKSRANELRKHHGLKWDEVKFKAERGNQSDAAGSSGGSSSAAPKKRFGVSRDGKTFTNAYGQTSRVDLSNRLNPSKGRRFRGYTDSQGNYHDID
jgi:hypothetical protein